MRLNEGGASVNAVTDKSAVPLPLAVRFDGTPEAIQVLFDDGALPNARRPQNSTALHVAVAYRDDPQVIEVLVENGADIHAVNELGESALVFGFAIDGNPVMRRALLDLGTDPNILDTNGLAAIHRTVETDDIEGMDLLLSGGASPSTPSGRGWPALIVVAALGETPDSLTLIDLLLKWGANPEARDTRLGGTSLHWAAAANRNPSPMVGKLLDRGFNIHAVDAKGRAPCEVAQPATAESETINWLCDRP